MAAAARIDALLSTLNASDVGSLDTIAARFEQVRSELADLGQPDLAATAAGAVAALRRGDVAEFRRSRAFLQSRLGHLRG